MYITVATGTCVHYQYMDYGPTTFNRCIHFDELVIYTIYCTIISMVKYAEQGDFSGNNK